MAAKNDEETPPGTPLISITCDRRKGRAIQKVDWDKDDATRFLSKVCTTANPATDGTPDKGSSGKPRP